MGSMPAPAFSGVVAVDKFDAAGTDYMRSLFPDVVEPHHPEFANWPEFAVGILVGLYPLTAKVIKSCKKLKFIVRHGAGYDNVDTEACKEAGVILCNLPGISASPVAEVALSLTCTCAKNVVQVTTQMRQGKRLTKADKSLWSATVLTGKKFGVIGGGQIGQVVAKKFIGAFDAQIVLYDPFVPKDGSGPWGSIPHERANSVDELLPIIDVVTLHVPLLPTTKNMITTKQLKTMKPTAILINCARGGVVNEEDLWQALREGTIATAGVDAWAKEPPTRETYGDVFDIENLVMSPHIGGGAMEVQTLLCSAMCDSMRELIDGKQPKHRVV